MHGYQMDSSDSLSDAGSYSAEQATAVAGMAQQMQDLSFFDGFQAAVAAAAAAAAVANGAYAVQTGTHDDAVMSDGDAP